MVIPDPLDRHRALRVLLGLVLIVVAIYTVGLIWSALALFGDVILLFFLAWIVAFILEPASILLQRRGLPRTLAVALIYLALLVVVSGAIVLALPSLGDEIRLLAGEIAHAFSAGNLSALSANAVEALRRLGLSDEAARGIVSSVSSQIPNLAARLPGDAVNATTSLFASVMTILFDAFLILIISFYMMLDGDRLVEGWVRHLPPAWIPDVRLFQGYVEQIFGGFFRAQLTIGAIYGVLVWLSLLLLGQANGLLVALLAGVFMLLPFIGPMLSFVPPVLLVLLQTPQDQLVLKLVLLGAMLFVAQQIVMQLVAPKVFGVQMGVHPLILFAALLVGAKVGGVWGAFFAGPIAGVGYAMLRVYYDRFARTSPLFRSRATMDGVTDQAAEEAVMAAEAAEGGSDLDLRKALPDALPAESRPRNRLPAGPATAARSE
ncbi:MAG TPA: AI-2E family transporter [Ktedonobacterales bacterium]|nr:AI-2E family transporter [Ktedonobacterales bacterium]